MSFQRWAEHLFSKMLILFKFSVIFSFANFTKQFRYFLSIRSCPDSGSVRGTSSPWVLRTANTIFPDLPRVIPEFRYPLSILEKKCKILLLLMLVKSVQKEIDLYLYLNFCFLVAFDVFTGKLLYRIIICKRLLMKK